MNELIKIANDNDRPTVSGRELHTVLEVETLYKDWFPRMCEYGFTNGIDYNPLNFEQVQLEGGREVKRNLVDHQLGLFEVKTRTIYNSDGSTRITCTTKVTGKGQIYFINKYCGKAPVQVGNCPLPASSPVPR